MELTPEEATEALRQMDRTGRQTEKRTGYAIAGPIMVLWGVIWGVCFGIAQFAPKWAGWAWSGGDLVGIVGSIWLGWIRARRWPVRSREGSRMLNRLALFWVALLTYGILWIVLGRSWPSEALSVYLVTLVMFASVTMGLWLQTPFLVGVGLLVTVLAAGGYLAARWCLPGLMDYLHVWLAVTGGGTLLLAGVRYWRKASGDE